jgi:hypothetical protein
VNVAALGDAGPALGAGGQLVPLDDGEALGVGVQV